MLYAHITCQFLSIFFMGKWVVFELSYTDPGNLRDLWKGNNLEGRRRFSIGLKFKHRIIFFIKGGKRN